MADKQRRPDIGNLISVASSDIQPIKRGAGLSGMIGGQRTSVEADERTPVPDAPTTRTEEASAPVRSEQARPSTPPVSRERRAPATRAPQAVDKQRNEAVTSTSRSTQRAINTARRRESAAESVMRQNKTFRLLPELARHIAVAAAERGIFEYSIIETVVEQFLTKRVPPTVTRPRDNAEMARRIRKSYSLRTDIVRDIAVMSATWGVFEYEIIEGAIIQYLPLSSRSV